MKTAIILATTLLLAAPAQAADLVTNGDFTNSTASSLLQSKHVAGPSAATGWLLWNNSAAVTSSALLANFQGRENVLHITTTGAYNGAFQMLGGEAHFGYADIWVASGEAAYLAVVNSSEIQAGRSATTGAWERVFLNTGDRAFDEVTLYSLNGPADFYVARASATVVPSAVPGVPEPATWVMMLIGFGALGSTMRRRPAKASIRFA